MPDLEILIKTRAELSGAQAAAAELERQIGKAKALGEEYGHLVPKLQHAHAEIAKSQAAGVGATPADMFGAIREGLREVVPGFAAVDGMASKLGAGTLGGIAAGFVAVRASIGLAKKSLDEFAEAEQYVARLDAALAQAGQLTEAYRERLQELAGELQRTTGVADDQWIGVLTRLTQFGADPDSIERYTEAVKDLAGLMGGDVQSAGNVFARALQGNFEMLGRYGIRVEEAGTQTDRLNRVMEQLGARGGGQLEAQTKTLTGRMTGLGNSVTDVFKGIGRLIAGTGVLQGALDFAGNAAEWWADKLEGAIPKAAGLQNALQKTTESSAEAAQAQTRAASALQETAKWAGEAANKYAALNEQVERQRRLQDEADNAEKAERKAKVDAAEKMGLISPRQAIRQRAALDREYAIRSQNRADEADNAKLGNNQRLIQDLRDRRSDLDEANKRDRDLLPEADKEDKRDSALASDRQRVESLREELAEAQSKISGSALSPSDSLQRQLDARAAELAADLAREEALLKRLESKAPNNRASGGVLRARIARRQAEIDELDKTRGPEIDKIEAENKRIEEERANRRRVFASQQRAERYTNAAGFYGADQQAGQRALDAIKTGAKGVGDGVGELAGDVVDTYRELGTEVAANRKDLAAARAEVRAAIAAAYNAARIAQAHAANQRTGQ
jgi:hypothetical protein